MSKPVDDNTSKPPRHSAGYVLNDKGEEIPITEEMVEKSMNEVKLHSMGVHTGFNKIITDDMLSEPEE